MDTNGTNQLAVVTGGSGGIGYALAKQFVQHGYDVVIAADDAGKLGDAARMLGAGKSGAAVETVQADLATGDGVETLYRALSGKGRPVDVLCVNAGIGSGGPFVETDLGRELTLIGLNVTGAVHLTKLVLRDMAKRNAGKILFTSSIASTSPDPFEAVYGASKSFLRSFAESLRNELKDTGVGITVLMPGVTDTEFFHRADMDDTRAGAGKKDDPDMVAKAGFDALMAGKDKVVSGLFNKTVTAVNNVLPEAASAALHRKLSEPGSAKR